MSISRTDLPADDRAPIGLAALVPQPPAWALDIAAGRSGPALSIADLERSRLVSTRITDCAALDAPRLERAVDDAYAVLADALEEADCDDADLIAHCRSSGSHVKGCWAVDLLLKRVIR